MCMANENKPQRPWYLDATKVVPLVVLLLGVPITGSQVWQLFQPDPPSVRVQYVIDVSSGMQGKIGQRRKLAAAKEEVISVVEGSPTYSHSLRLIGPECDKRYHSPEVPFAQDNADSFERALKRLPAAGKTNFANTVRHAVNDLSRAQGEEGTRIASVYFLVGGVEACTSSADKVIVDSLVTLDPKKTGDLNFKFIGVRAPPEMEKLLKRVKRQAKKRGVVVRLTFARTVDDLEHALPDSEPVPSGK